MNAGLLKRGVLWFAAFAAGLAVGAGAMALLATHGDVPTPPSVEPGTEVLGIDPEAVLVLTFSNDRLMLTAQRSRTTDRFAVQVTFADGRPPQTCLAPTDLAGLLAQFAHLIAGQPVSPQRWDTDFPQSLGVVELKDAVASEPIAPMTFRASADGRIQAVRYDGLVFETQAPVQTLVRLGAGCAGVAAR